MKLNTRLPNARGDNAIISKIKLDIRTFLQVIFALIIRDILLMKLTRFTLCSAHNIFIGMPHTQQFKSLYIEKEI